jgi:fructose-1-phosphate kinase PfkB-like protein
MTVTDAIRLGLAAGTSNTQFDETGLVDPEMVSRLFTQVQPQRC